MAKNDRLVRLLNMILVIQAHPGKSIRELAGSCGVGERQCFRELTTREVEPYHLVFNEGFWYLVAYCHQREQIRLFRVDRIKRLEETGAGFELPPDFSYQNYIGAAWGMERGEEYTFKVKFYGDGARYVRETMFHPSQRLEEDDDGAVIFTAKACGLKAVSRWLLSFGNDAEVLEPASLREMVQEKLKMALGRY